MSSVAEENEEIELPLPECRVEWSLCRMNYGYGFLSPWAHHIFYVSFWLNAPKEDRLSECNSTHCTRNEKKRFFYWILPFLTQHLNRQTKYDGRKREWTGTLFCWLSSLTFYIWIDSNTLDLPKLVDCPWYFALYSSLFRSLSPSLSLSLDIIYYMFNIIAVMCILFSLLCLELCFYVFFQSFFSVGISKCVFFSFVRSFCFWKESKARDRKEKKTTTNGIQKKFCVGSFGRDIFIKDCCVVTSSLIFRSSFLIKSFRWFS